MTYEEFLEEWRNGADSVAVTTSGTTGVAKHMLVSKDRMRCSAMMTGSFLGLKRGDTALLCMPVDYIAGKMMVVRAETLGLRLTVVAPSSRPFRDVTSMPEQGFDFVAMVPSQVFETLQHDDEALLMRRSRHLIIGGGAVSDALAETLKTFPNAVWSTYGMTETLSHVAMRRLDGSHSTSWYTPMPGVHVSLNSDSCLVVDAPRLCSAPVVTNDIAELSACGFRIKGRRDNVICSGGIKIHIEEVESKLEEHLSLPFAISKMPDMKYGEAVVIVTESTDCDAVSRICREHLPRYWSPKQVIHTDCLPMTETGKVARAEVEMLVKEITSGGL